MAFQPKATSNQDDGDGRIRVMVVDDSAVIRGLIKKTLEGDPEVAVVASAHDGEQALRELGRAAVDVVVLDIEMPGMDGLTALPKLLEKQPGLKVVMASTLTLKNAEVSMKAMELGAADYIPKPTTNREITSGSDFRSELLMKVKSLGAMKRGEKDLPAPKVQPRRAFTSESRGAQPVSKFRRDAPAQAPAGAAKPIATPMFLPEGDITLRKAGTSRPDILAVGSSTGGPQALFKFFAGLDKTLPVPIVLTQHMPPTFTTILAQHIARATGWDCIEAEHGEPLKPRRIHLAPGGYHLTVEAKGAGRAVALNQNPPENFCRPAVDPMLRSLVPIYGPHIVAVILTGMGVDGLKGCEQVVAAGGTVIAQDKATSVVWGMPGAVATQGLCSAVLPLDDIAGHVNDFVRKAARL